MAEYILIAGLVVIVIIIIAMGTGEEGYRDGTMVPIFFDYGGQNQYAVDAIPLGGNTTKYPSQDFQLARLYTGENEGIYPLTVPDHRYWHI